MKLLLITLIIMVLFMSSLTSAQTTDDTPETPSAIAIFKQNTKVKTLLAKHSDKQYSVSFGEVDMGGSCGYVGCQWQKLVSMVITSNRANAPSVTFLAVVEGSIPDRGTQPTVRFVDLVDMDVGKWARQL